ncbi:ATP-dependent protease ClpP, protease subunit [Kaistia soli DSM 19436]|uniref:ATP-dependent Clp protease proteolytic subunit n=1 Tax=Kaistia soli DSM 19436 TaxID=1122133 RepID=A0A1M4VFF1_9HYPH|nr:head maturation protease, ClpP-related [Kaistia soli]SHE67754.1 ATP-dependent protease ClpP, protease subunit [Kaistia soli DSM 19436]
MPHRLIVNDELVLYGYVGIASWFDESGFTAREVIEALAEIEGDVVVRINSPGGIATEGSAIYAALVAHDGTVTVRIEGIAASAASVIAMAGEEIIMANGSLMMIHDPAGVTIGTAADHRATAVALDVMAGAMARIYAKRSGKSVAEARAIMQAETWFDGSEAVAQGFATSDETGGAIEAAVPIFDYRSFQHAPDRLVAQADRWRSEGRKLAAFGQPTASAISTSPATVVASPASASTGTKEATVPEMKDITLSMVREQRGDLVKELLASADVTAMATASAAAERDRILGIENLGATGHDALVAEMKADGKTSPAEAALRIMGAEKATRGTRMQALADADKTVPVATAPTANPQPAAPVAPVPVVAASPDGWKAEFVASADLQAEFRSVEAYVAFKSATADGRARIKAA